MTEDTPETDTRRCTHCAEVCSTARARAGGRERTVLYPGPAETVDFRFANTEVTMRTRPGLPARPRAALAAGLLLWLLVGCVGCTSTHSLVRSFAPTGKTVLLVVDISNSMNSNDPQRFATQGAQLAASLIKQGDNLGCITYSTRARVLAPVREVKGARDRLEVIEALERARPWGETNFVSAIRLAQQTLEAANAKAGATVIFLTDGRPSRQSAELLARELGGSIEKGWRVFSMTLGSAAHDKVTARMAAVTGGAYYHVGEPRELIEAFLSILGDIEDYLVYRGAERSVRALAGTEGLAFVALEPKGRFERLFFEGGEQALGDPARCFHFPSRGSPRRDFEVAHVLAPEPGRWEIEASIPPRAGYILQKPPFRLDFVSGYPRRSYKRGEAAAFALRVRGENAEVLEQLRAQASVEVRLRGETGEPRTIALELAAVSGRELIYEGSARLSGEPATYTANARVRVRFSDRAEAEIGKSVSFVVEDALGYALLCDTPVADAGAALAGGADLRAEVVLRAQGAAVDVSGLAVEGGGVAPAALRLPADGAATVVVTLPARGSLGRQGFALRGTATSGEVALPFPEVRVERSLYALSGPDAFRFALAPGEAASQPLGLRLEPAVPGAAPGLIAPSFEAGAGLRATVGDSLTVTASADARPGSYRGSLAVELPEGLRAELPCRVEVAAPRPRLELPAALELGGAPGGSATGRCEVVLRYRAACDVQLSGGTLEGPDGARIAPRYDLELTPEGWGGARLEVGTPRAWTVRVWLGSDLPPGTYAGSLTLVCSPDDGGEAARHELPLRVEVGR